MSDCITLTLNYPPSINHYYMRLKNRVVIAPRGQEYRTNQVLSIKMQLYKQSLKFIDTPLKCTIDLYLPDKRKRDIDNILKCLLDTLTYSEVYADDSLIYDLHVIKHKFESKATSNFVIVKLEKLENIL